MKSPLDIEVDCCIILDHSPKNDPGSIKRLRFYIQALQRHDNVAVTEDGSVVVTPKIGQPMKVFKPSLVKVA